MHPTKVNLLIGLLGGGMSIIDFDLAAERGGRKQFTDLPEAILWVQHQADAWDNAFRRLTRGNSNPTLSAVSSRWHVVAADLQKKRKNGDPVALSFPDEPELVTDQSPMFLALSWMAGLVALEGVVAAGTAAGLPGTINWNDLGQTSAVLLYDRALQRVLVSSGQDESSLLHSASMRIGSDVSRARESLVKIEEQIAQIASAANQTEATGHARLAELEAAVGSTEFSANARISELDQQLSSLSQRAGTTIDDLTASSKATIDNWFATFKEQRQLEAPIKLWEQRAESHEAMLESRKGWMIGVGVCGLLAAAVVALGAFEGAQYLFNDAILPAVKGELLSKDGMRPSFHFELLFASAATLLYLTMYLWTMKLLVRLYTTEHHLGLDARGRAALTETYLSFRREGAATDADRAIMLGVIFRPVADGMVKEDGLPAISPAALLASMASGPVKVG